MPFSILQEILILVLSRCCIHRWQSKCVSMPSNDDFSLSVLVGNTVLPEYSHGGVCYVECDLFTPVSFKQRTEERVGQELEVQVGHSLTFRIIKKGGGVDYYKSRLGPIIQMRYNIPNGIWISNAKKKKILFCKKYSTYTSKSCIRIYKMWQLLVNNFFFISYKHDKLLFISLHCITYIW